jgi:rSAM/selenodomain-associated transferase 2
MVHRVSVIVPVRNEALVLPGLIEALRALDPSPEIVVSESGSTDNSCQVAEACGATIAQGPGGRGPQLNSGAQVAIGDVLLFLHADSQLPAESWKALHESLNDPLVEAGCFRFSLAGTDGFWPRVYEFFVDRRTRWMNLPYGDQGYFVRRECWDRVGPFAPVPLMEDVQWWQRLSRVTRPVGLKSILVTSPRRFQRRGWLSSALRNLMLIAAWRLGVSPQRLAKLYS